MKITIKLEDREICGEPTEGIVPWGKMFKPFGVYPEQETPVEFQKLMRKELPGILERTYQELLDHSHSFEDMNADFMVEHLEEELGPKLDQILIDLWYQTKELDKTKS